MGWFVASMIFLIIAIVVAVVALKARKTLKNMYDENAKSDNSEQQRYRNAVHSDNSLDTQRGKAIVLGIVAGVCALLGLVILGLDSYVVVPARNVGVVNILGNANSSVSNGFHLVQPWASVENVDTTNKPIQLNDDGNVDNGCTSIAVRLATQTTACQDVFIQWQVDPKGDANDLWRTYRGSNDDLIDNIQNNVILPRLRSEMQKAFSTYDPLAVLQGGKLQDTTTLQDPIKAVLKGDMPDGVLLLDVRFGQIHYDNATQSKINAYSQAVADTKIAQQQEQTASAQALANKQLASDPSTNSAGVQFQNCLNLINTLASKGQLAGLPVNSLQCVAGGGSGAPVIVQQK